MAKRIGLALLVSLVAAAPLSAAEIGVALAIQPVGSAPLLAEPFDATIRVTNLGLLPLITTESALSAGELWPYLELTRILPDGSEVPVTADRPLSTPPPASRWAQRGGTLVPVEPAVIVPPGEFVDVVLLNFLLFVPLADPGAYRLGFAGTFPIYTETFTDPAYGDVLLVVRGEEAWTAAEVTEAAFTLGLPPGGTQEDADWFRAARRLLLTSWTVEDAVDAFALPEGASAYLRACSQYWIGLAYEAYGDLDGASTAYETVLEQFAESVFASYAQTRLDEIAAFKAAQAP